MAEERGLLLDVPVEEWLPLVNRAGGNRSPVIGQLDPWSDGVLSREDLPQLNAEVDYLEGAAGNDVERGLRVLLVRWHGESDLVLHWYGD